MSADRAAIMAVILEAMGTAWSDSEEYAALPGQAADLLLLSDWLEQVRREARAEALRQAADDYSSAAHQGAYLTPEARTFLRERADREER